MATTVTVPTWFYQHGDADFTLDVPEEAFGGWKRANLDLSLDNTAVVVMHAWDAGTSPDQFPGWWRVVPYIVRANAIMETTFPPLLEAVRRSPMPLFHVVAGGDYYKHLPGYERAAELAPRQENTVEKIAPDPVLQTALGYKNEHGYPRPHNVPDIQRGFSRIDFGPHAHPQGDEGVAENGPQLYGLCRAHNITHLIYMGFAINWCLLLSPGGMAEMTYQYGVTCSAFRQATAAVENKASARDQWCKELALWRVALAFGFVYDVDDFITALKTSGSATGTAQP
ncbi:MAG TPA: hypothetical protein PLD73_00265 [Candidatus Hydrogenedentes bacterium]|jgi:hypothetical protein|nr:hypothetical protein [Candidatus Hydrogenedentota bacterium]HPJ98230.1 hypothetical protein [Candidatus Hydrogenedentota bacterium]